MREKFINDEKQDKVPSNLYNAAQTPSKRKYIKPSKKAGAIPTKRNGKRRVNGRGKEGIKCDMRQKMEKRRNLKRRKIEKTKKAKRSIQ